MFRVLAPERHTLGMDFEEYRQHYDDILRNLDPRATWNELHKLAGGHEPVLLCFERPPFHRNNWCHRRMVAAWFAATLNEDVKSSQSGWSACSASPSDRPQLGNFASNRPKTDPNLRVSLRSASLRTAAKPCKIGFFVCRTRPPGPGSLAHVQDQFLGEIAGRASASPQAKDMVSFR